MARVIGFSAPPSMAAGFFRAVGVPRSTGFQVWVTGYEYGIGESIGKRLPRAFRARQGMTAPTLTPATIENRTRFQHGMQVWWRQPSYTPGVPEYGGIGVNIWQDRADVEGLTAHAEFMSAQMPYEVAEEISPWDTKYFVSILADGPGDNTSYAMSAALPAGMYRVSMMPSSWGWFWTSWKYLVAITVVRVNAEETVDAMDVLGDVDPAMFWQYCIPASMYDSAAEAWTGYLNDGGTLSVDVPISEGDRVGVQYKNWKGVPDQGHVGELLVKMEVV